MKRFCTLLMLFIPLSFAYGQTNSQEQFDKINDAITKAIKQGEKNIKVKIGSGVYHFRENLMLTRARNNKYHDTFDNLEKVEEDVKRERFSVSPTFPK